MADFLISGGNVDTDRHSGRTPGDDEDGGQSSATEVKAHGRLPADTGSNAHTNQTVKQQDSQTALSTLHRVAPSQQ